MIIANLKIYYTGIGDYRNSHIYSPDEFMAIISTSKNRFILTETLPKFDLNSYTIEDLAEVVCWTGALVEFLDN